MINWREQTNNPVDKEILNKVLQYILSIRKKLVDYEKYIKQEVTNKSVLDIGICEHTIERMNSKNWKHRIILDNSNYCLGIDIDKILINKLLEQKYNVKYCDATSDDFLGEKFDIIHIGDVIEHVSNPIALLQFAKKHLNENGKIIVRTPNPFNFNYIYLQKKNGTSIENLEHISYITPFHAHEIALRTNLVLKNYLVLFPRGFSKQGFLYAGYYILKHHSFRHAFAEFFSKPESYTTIYVYEFTL